LSVSFPVQIIYRIVHSFVSRFRYTISQWDLLTHCYWTDQSVTLTYLLLVRWLVRFEVAAGQSRPIVVSRWHNSLVVM